MTDQATTPAYDCHAADAAYQAHHSRCAHCIAAGVTQGERGRCTVGQALWTTYVEAGMPPFFTQPLKGASTCVSTSPAQ